MTPATASRPLQDPPPAFLDRVVVERIQENGKTVVIVTDPSTGVRERFSERSYGAVASLPEYGTLQGWLDAMLASHPNAAPDKLLALVDKCVAQGLLVSRSVRPAPPMRRGGRGVVVEGAMNSLEGPVVEPAMRPKLNKSVTRVGALPPTASPQARVDLSWAPGPIDKLFAVTHQRSAAPVYLFAAEVEALQLLDGKRNALDVLNAMRARGWKVSGDQLARWLVDMASLGVLVDTGGAATLKNLAPTPWFTEPGPDVETDAWSQEEQKIFEGAVRLIRKGAVADALAQCEMLLGLHPFHSETQRLMQALGPAAKSGEVFPQGSADDFVPAPAERTQILQLPDEVMRSLGGPAAPPPPVAMPSPQPAPVAPPPAPAAAPAQEAAPVEAEAAPSTEGAYEDAARQIDSDPDVVRRRRLQRLARIGRALIVPAILCAVGIVVPYPLTITYPAVVKPSERFVVRSPRTGVIGEILVEEGERVKAEQVLGNLVNADQKTKVITTQAGVDKMRAELKLLLEGNREEEIARAEARVGGAYRELNVAKQRLDRVRGLVKQGVAPRTELEQAQAQVAQLSGAANQAQAELNLVRAGAREDEVKKKEAELRSIEAQLQFEQELFENTVLRTSLGGIVTTAKPKELLNTRVQAGDPVVEVANLDNMRVEVLVNERDFDVLKLGLPVELKVAAHPTEAFTGVVTRIGSQVEPTPDGNIVRAEAQIKNEQGLLVPNMTGYAGIQAEKRPLLSLVGRRLLRWMRVRFLL